MNRNTQAVALILCAALALAAAFTVPRGVAAARALVAADDPAALADLALDASFDAARAEREIVEALDAGDADLARSLLELAGERSLAIAPALAERVRAANAFSVAGAASSLARGFVTGESREGYGLAGAMLGDLFVFGDIRDGVREGARLARGAEADKALLALSAAGLALTAGTYATMGATAPVRAGLSLGKVASRSGRISGTLARAIRAESPAGLARLFGDLGRVQAKAGARAALDGIRIVDGPKDARRLARLAEAKGTRTRAVVKLLGRGAIGLTTAAADLAAFVFGALANVIGFCAALKRATERATLGILRRRRQKAAMRAAALKGAAPAG